MADRAMTCPERAQGFGPWERTEGIDFWRSSPNGDRTCSFCGSLHEDDFIAICEAYAAGEPGFHFDPTSKSYKRYARRPGVLNAKQGGIKFYTWHTDRSDPAALARRAAIYKSAVLRFFDQVRDRFDGDIGEVVSARNPSPEELRKARLASMPRGSIERIDFLLDELDAEAKAEGLWARACNSIRSLFRKGRDKPS